VLQFRDIVCLQQNPVMRTSLGDFSTDCRVKEAGCSGTARNKYPCDWSMQ
jgi:hypothetical protein